MPTFLNTSRLTYWLRPWSMTWATRSCNLFRGVNNMFLVKSSSEMAITYNGSAFIQTPRYWRTTPWLWDFAWWTSLRYLAAMLPPYNKPPENPWSSWCSQLICPSTLMIWACWTTGSFRTISILQPRTKILPCRYVYYFFLFYRLYYIARISATAFALGKPAKNGSTAWSMSFSHR